MLQSTAADISAEATTTENHNYLRRIQTATNNTPIITTEENQSVTLDILHINDHHSHLDDKTMTIPQRILPTVQNRQVRFGGFPRLINLFRQYSNSTSHPEATNILKLHAGDALSGTGFYRWFGHQPDVDLMHEICFDAVTLGNHEFNDGDGPLAEFLTKLTDIK